jgi:hypothetical protein
LKKGGDLLIKLSIPVVKKVYEYLLKEKSGTQHKGGFLPILLAALGAIGSLAGGAAAITSAVHKKEKENKELEEQKRHNLAMEGVKKIEMIKKYPHPLSNFDIEELVKKYKKKIRCFYD